MKARSAENVAIALFVKAHHQSLADDRSGRAQITGTAQHCVYRLVRGVLAAFEVSDFFALRNRHCRRFRQQL